MKISSWIKAFRLRTLPLSMSGIIMGSFIAKRDGYWNSSIFIFAMLTTLFFQILSNLANDLGDAQKGTDNDNRVGPVRAIQSGEITSEQMKVAVSVFSLLSILSASFLIFLSSKGMTFEVVILYSVLAVLSIIAAITYTVGKKAYGYSGFGDVFVFVFFGLVSVLGSYSLYSKIFNWHVLLPALSIGFLSTAVLNLNNMRDHVNDKAQNKNTLVVKFGLKKAKVYHMFLIGLAIITLILFILNLGFLSLVFVFPISVLLFHLRRVLHIKDEKVFDPELKKVALSTFTIALIYALVVFIFK
jgi:1,4-dihydroxy-2-naphthoate octaprenyltransferase